MKTHLALALLLALGPLAAQAAERPVSIETGIGFTSHPGSFLLTTELPVEVARDVEIGPSLQLGIGDNRLIAAPSLNVRYGFPLSRVVRDRNPVWARLRPMAHGGLGFAYLERDKPGDDDDLGFLFLVGAGLQYDWSERVAFGTRMSFNVMPARVLGDRFFFSWQLAQLRYRF